MGGSLTGRISEEMQVHDLEPGPGGSRTHASSLEDPHRAGKLPTQQPSPLRSQPPPHLHTGVLAAHLSSARASSEVSGERPTLSGGMGQGPGALLSRRLGSVASICSSQGDLAPSIDGTVGGQAQPPGLGAAAAAGSAGAAGGRPSAETGTATGGAAGGSGPPSRRVRIVVAGDRPSAQGFTTVQGYNTGGGVEGQGDHSFSGPQALMSDFGAPPPSLTNAGPSLGNNPFSAGGAVATNGFGLAMGRSFSLSRNVLGAGGTSSPGSVRNKEVVVVLSCWGGGMGCWLRWGVGRMRACCAPPAPAACAVAWAPEPRLHQPATRLLSTLLSRKLTGLHPCLLCSCPPQPAFQVNRWVRGGQSQVMGTVPPGMMGLGVAGRRRSTTSLSAASPAPGASLDALGPLWGAPQVPPSFDALGSGSNTLLTTAGSAGPPTPTAPGGGPWYGTAAAAMGARGSNAQLPGLQHQSSNGTGGVLGPSPDWLAGAWRW